MQFCYPVGIGKNDADPAFRSKGLQFSSQNRDLMIHSMDRQDLRKVETFDVKPPQNLKYASSSFEFMMDTEVTTNRPTYENEITEFSISPSDSLPEGLKLNSATGEISGKPTRIGDYYSFTVTGMNSAGSATTVIRIVVRKDFCPAGGQFPRTDVGSADIVVPCDESQGLYGEDVRRCVLGKKNGEWQIIKSCSAKSPKETIIVVVVVIVVIAAVVGVVLVQKKKKNMTVSIKHPQDIEGNGRMLG